MVKNISGGYSNSVKIVKTVELGMETNTEQ